MILRRNTRKDTLLMGGMWSPESGFGVRTLDTQRRKGNPGRFLGSAVNSNHKM